MATAAPTAPIRTLTAADAAAFRELRLEALERHPTAFTADVDALRRQRPDEIAPRIAPPGDSFVLGAFPAPDTLVGMVGLHREEAPKLRHRGTIWGMYVRREAQRHGLGRALLEAAVVRARALPGLAVVELGVETTNTAALRLYESCGFVPYGTQRDALRVDGRSYDELLLALHVV